MDLTPAVDVKTISDVMSKDPKVAERLAAHLPPVDPEDQQPTITENVASNLRSPQFRSALKVRLILFE